MRAGGKRQPSRASNSHTRASKRGKHHHHHLSLAGFWTLPSELRSLILSLACYKSTSVSDKRPRLDTKTTLSLARTSRLFHLAVGDRLWTQPKINRPSKLIAFHRALVQYPEKSLLVKSLHLGPLQTIGEGWWPIRFPIHDDEDYDGYSDYEVYEQNNDEVAKSFVRNAVLVCTSLGHLEKDKSPRWCKPNAEFLWGDTRQDCARRAIQAALQAAALALDVDPSKEGYFKPSVAMVSEATVAND